MSQSYNCIEITTYGKIVFHKLPPGGNLKKLQEMVSGNISILYHGEDFPCKGNRKLPFVVFANENGMYENLSMNQVTNPLLPEHVLIHCARYGGPFGTLVFFLEENPRSSIDLETIRDTYSKYSDTVDFDEWKDIILESVNSEGEKVF